MCISPKDTYRLPQNLSDQVEKMSYFFDLRQKLFSSSPRHFKEMADWIRMTASLIMRRFGGSASTGSGELPAVHPHQRNGALLPVPPFRRNGTALTRASCHRGNPDFSHPCGPASSPEGTSCNSRDPRHWLWRSR